MNVEKFRNELIADHPIIDRVNEAKVQAIAEHMRQRISIRNEVRARAIGIYCYYESIKAVVLMFDFNVACTIRPDWEKAAKMMEASAFAKREPRAAKRAAAMLRKGL